MSYKRSRARISAQNRMKDLRRPFSFIRQRTKQIPGEVREAVLYNCVFQLSSILEDYILACFEDWISALNGQPNSKLPLRARSIVTAKKQEQSFRHFVAFGDEGKLATRLEERRSDLEFMDDKRPIDNTGIIKILVKDRKFPTPENIRSVFSRVGVNNMVHEISKFTRSNAEYSIRSFYDVRNAIAHEAPPNITEIDVDRYFKQVDKWISAIDRRMCRHVRDCSGSSFWTTS